tara:strand:+ start:2465 stop:2752 length:288 start_codon:yes stop_codon:yes gene_type:complete
MKANNYAARAVDILEERGKEHGDFNKLFDEMGSLFSFILANKLKDDITPYEAALLMVALKLARMQQKGTGTQDSILDAIGYLSIAGALYEKEKKS